MLEVIESLDEVVLVNFSLFHFVLQFQRNTFYQARKYVAIGMEAGSRGWLIILYPYSGSRNQTGSLGFTLSDSFPPVSLDLIKVP